MAAKRDEFPTAAPFVPQRPTLAKLREAVSACQGCDLYRGATQGVFGVGPIGAKVMLIGEQPGDQEDRAGEPFVGPAGKLLDRALAEAEIERKQVYVTNAVKHFKFVLRGKRRLHQKPTVREVRACRPWLEQELGLVRPQIVVCLGATAAQALLGARFRVTEQRGRFLATPWAPALLATVHPSAILRAPEEEARRRAYAGFVADLRMVAARLGESPAGRGEAA